MNLKDFQKIEKEGNKEFGIVIYKKDFSTKNKFENVNEINIEKQCINEKGTNNQIILSDNKTRKKSGIMHNLEEKFNIKNLDFKNLNYQDDANPSSIRNLNKLNYEEEVSFDNNELKNNKISGNSKVNCRRRRKSDHRRRCDICYLSKKSRLGRC